MKTIYKYNLDITDSQLIELPIDSEILSVKCQDNFLCMWLLIEVGTIETTSLEIEIFGTGNPIYENNKTSRKFVDTVVMPNGLVWHVFIRIN